MIHKVGLILAISALGFSSWFASTSRGDVNHIDAPQAATDIPDWLKNSGTVIGLAAGPGIAIWYLWYDTTRVKPKMQRDFREQVETIIQRYTQMAKETEDRHTSHWTLAQNQFMADRHETLKDWREDMQALRNAIDKLSDSVNGNECRYTPPRNAG